MHPPGYPPVQYTVYSSDGCRLGPRRGLYRGGTSWSCRRDTTLGPGLQTTVDRQRSVGAVAEREKLPLPAASCPRASIQRTGGSGRILLVVDRRSAGCRQPWAGLRWTTERMALAASGDQRSANSRLDPAGRWLGQERGRSLWPSRSGGLRAASRRGRLPPAVESPSATSSHGAVVPSIVLIGRPSAAYQVVWLGYTRPPCPTRSIDAEAMLLVTLIKTLVE